MAVYQDQDEKNRTISDDDLRHITGINPEQEGAHDRNAHHGAARDILARSEAAAVRPKGAGGATLGALGAAKAGEDAGAAGPGGDTLGKGFTGATGAAASAAMMPAGAKPLNLLKKGVTALWSDKKARRRTATGGGIALGAGAGLVIVFSSLGSQVLVQIMTSIEENTFKSVQQDTKDEGQKLLSHYVTRRILVRLGKTCKVSSDMAKCIPKPAEEADPKKDPVNNTYDNWDKQNLPESLANEGVEFEKKDGRFLMKVKSIRGVTTVRDITKEAAQKGANFFDTSKVKAYAAKQGVEAANLAYSHVLVPLGSFLYNRFTAFMESRYGYTFCTLLCKPNEDTTTKVDNDTAKKAADGYEREKVVKPTYAAEGEAISCLANTDCDAGQKPEPKGEANPDNPSAKTEFEENINKSVKDAEGKARSDSIDLKESEKEADLARADKGKGAAIKDMIKVLTKGAVKTVEAFAKFITKFIKFAGSGPVAIVQIAAALLETLSKIGPKIKAMNYALHAAPALAMFSTYASVSDEQRHGGHYDLRQSGSFANNIAGGSKTPAYDGFADPNNNHNTVQTINVWLVQHKMAFNALSGGGNAVAKMSEVYNSIPGIKYLTGTAHLINKISTIIAAPASFVFEQLHLNELIGKVAGPLFEYMITHLLSVPDLSHMTPDERMALIIGGANEGSKQAGQNIGQQRITPQQAGRITEKGLQEDRREFQQQPLFARLFSFDTPYSLASRMAIAMPQTFGGTFSSAMQTVSMDLLSNPFGRFFGGFSSLFRSNFVHAANIPSKYLTYGIADYGRPNGIHTEDPETYWTSHKCAEKAAEGYKDWEKSRKYDEDTGQWEYTTTNDCLLIQQTSYAMCEAVGAKQVDDSTCPVKQPNAAATTAVRGIHIIQNNQPSDYGKLKELGYNVVDVDPGNIGTLPDGMQGLVWVGGVICSNPMPMNEFKSIVDKNKNNNKVFAYFLQDEPDTHKCPDIVGKIRERADYIHKVAPNQKAYFVDEYSHDYQRVREELTHADIWAIDPYPCRPNGCDWGVVDQLAASAKHAYPEAKIAPTYQAFGGDGWRMPTAAEMKTLLEHWDKALPGSVADVVYTWRNPGDSPDPLIKHPDLQNILKTHNQGAATAN